MHFPHLKMVLMAVLLLSTCKPYGSDTTYSETRQVPKKREPYVSVSPETGSESHINSFDSEEGPNNQTFMQECMSPGEIKSFSALGGYIVSAPFRLGFCYVADNFRISHINLFNGTPEMSSLPNREWRFGWGFGFGFMYMPQTAGGMPFTLHAEALRSFSPRNQWRLRVSSFGSILGTTSDFARTVSVNGNPIGVQQDHLTHYSQSGYPMLMEKLWTNENGLYFSLGGGTVYQQEELHFAQSTDYGIAPVELSENHSGFKPIASLCIGRFDSRANGKKFHRFELRYQITALFPNHQSSFPSDNTYSTHSLTWDWGWLW
jgi:hypothetical protein